MPVLNRIPCIIFVCLGLATSTAAEIRVLELAAEPAYRREIVGREVWRCGLGPDDPLIGMISSAVEDPRGNVYILDIQLQRIISFAPDGAFRGVTCGSGPGPGEIENICALTSVDGNPGIVDMLPPAAVRTVDTTGRPLETIRITNETGDPNGVGLWNASVGDERMLFNTVAFSYETDVVAQINALDLHDRSGRAIRRLATKRAEKPAGRCERVDERDMTIPFRDAFCLLPGDVSAFAPLRDEYRIDLCDPAGEPTSRLLDPYYLPHTRTDEERRRAADNITVTSGNEILDVEKHVCDTDPVFISFTARGSRIWARTMRGYRTLGAGRTAIYDEIDPATGVRGEVVLILPDDARDDHLIWTSDTRLLRIRNTSRTEDEEGPEIIAYEVADSAD